MRQKSITVNVLDQGSIDRALDEIAEYKRNLEWKCETIRKKVSELMVEVANSRLQGAIVDDYTEVTQQEYGVMPKEANVTVTRSPEGEAMLVIAGGKDAVFVEFGAGVFHNGSVGGSPNPLAKQNDLPYLIGSFGKKGADEKWAFTVEKGRRNGAVTEKGVTYWTYGTPAAMPLYQAVLAAKDQIAAIAREVFEQ